MKFGGEKVSLQSRATGIFSPRQMQTLLSIKTVVQKPGRRAWYQDQQPDKEQFFGDREHWEYSLERGGPQKFGNRLIERAAAERTPLIYFKGVAPGLYEPIVPAFILDVNHDSESCRVVPGDPRVVPGQSVGPGGLPSIDERRYQIRRIQARLHQSRFRAAVLQAYGRRCAVTGLPVTSLLDAAHIVEDGDSDLGQPVVPNGLPLSKIHHAAFDSHLLGIDPDYRIHISDRLADESDGPLLDLLKGAAGRRILRPGQRHNYPDPQRLEKRFEIFESLT